MVMMRFRLVCRSMSNCLLHRFADTVSCLAAYVALNGKFPLKILALKSAKSEIKLKCI